jgi:hypothetical protein
LIKAIKNESPTFLKAVLSQMLTQAIQEDDTEFLSAIFNALKTDVECQIILQLILMQPCDNESTPLSRIAQNGKTAAFKTLCNTLKDKPKLLEAILTQPNNSSDTPSPQDTNTAVFKTMINFLPIDKKVLKTAFQPPNEENLVPLPTGTRGDATDITNNIRIILTKIAASGRLNEVIDKFKTITKFE